MSSNRSNESDEDYVVMSESSNSSTDFDEESEVVEDDLEVGGDETASEPPSAVSSQSTASGSQSLSSNVNSQVLGRPVEGHQAEANETQESTMTVDEALKSPSPVKLSPKVSCKAAASPNKSLEDDGQTCTICFEPWTNSSDHRLVSLRCGHLYGRSCISRWLQGQNARCPQCNARARKSEIRNIYARTIKVLDTSDRDRALKALEKETELRRKAEIEATQEKLKCVLTHQECERLKRELMETKQMLREARMGIKLGECRSQAASAKSPCFYLERNVEISKLGGCRIFDICELLGTLVISQPSTNELFHGYGFRRVSMMDMNPTDFVLVHQKPIKDLSFHVHDGLVLTASLDRTVKLTSIITNSVVQTYNLDSDVWSCSWDVDDPIYFYAGEKNGGVFLFDIRVTSRHVSELPRLGANGPVVSLQYLKKTGAASKCGPLVGKLSTCGFYEKFPACSYMVEMLPLSGLFTSLSSEPITGHFLVSSRPSFKQPRVTHTLCAFENSNGYPSFHPVQTIQGGCNQVQLTRSKLLPHPEKESSLLVCAGDEDAHGALIWDGGSGICLNTLKTDSPVLDIAGLKINHKSHLACLTDRTLRLYSWAG